MRRFSGKSIARTVSVSRMIATPPVADDAVQEAQEAEDHAGDPVEEPEVLAQDVVERLVARREDFRVLGTGVHDELVSRLGAEIGEGQRQDALDEDVAEALHWIIP